MQEGSNGTRFVFWAQNIISLSHSTCPVAMVGLWQVARCKLPRPSTMGPIVTDYLRSQHAKTAWWILAGAESSRHSRFYFPLDPLRRLKFYVVVLDRVVNALGGWMFGRVKP
jgi:hypothetical protein